MSKLLSTLSITIFGSFSFVAFADPTEELQFNSKEINKEIEVSLSQTMEKMMHNLFDDKHQTLLIAKKENKALDTLEEATEE